MQFGRHPLSPAYGPRSVWGSNHNNPWDWRMPRIDDRLMECVFYIYPDLEAAQKGESVGGTGFFTHIVSEADPEKKYLYAVTNRHIIDDIKADNPVIRINKRDGWPEENRFKETKREDWKFLSDAPEDDLAVYSLGVETGFSIGVDEFLTVGKAHPVVPG